MSKPNSIWGTDHPRINLRHTSAFFNEFSVKIHEAEEYYLPKTPSIALRSIIMETKRFCEAESIVLSEVKRKREWVEAKRELAKMDTMADNLSARALQFRRTPPQASITETKSEDSQAIRSTQANLPGTLPSFRS